MKARELLDRYADGHRNFQGANLRGQSFEGEDLSGINLSRADLRAASFMNAILKNANLTAADARGCDFEGADLSSAVLRQVKTGQSRKQLINNTFREAEAVGIIVAVSLAFLFAFASIQRFAESEIISGCLNIAISSFSAVAAIYFYRKLVNTVKSEIGNYFWNANLTDADFSHSNIRNSDFSYAILTRTNWTSVKVSYCKFLQVNFENFDDPKIQNLCTLRNGQAYSYQNANLRNLNLAGVDLSGVNLEGADLSGTNLSHADLTNTNLSKIQAFNTNFSHANLTGACIENWRR